MTDHPDPGPDPLAGRDPHPRAQLDIWPLHDARQELLEEIVSQPGTDQSSRRILVPVGIAAALLLVVGGAWAAIGTGGNDKKDDDTVAASVVSTAADTPTTPTTAATPTDTSEPAAPVKKHRRDRADQLRSLDRVTNLRDCLRTVRHSRVGPKDYVRIRRMVTGRKHDDMRLYLVRRNGRVVVVDGRCRTFDVRRGRMPRH